MILPASHIMSAGKKQYGILNILIGSTALYTSSLLLLAQATGQVPCTQLYTNSNYIIQSQSTGTPTHPLTLYKFGHYIHTMLNWEQHLCDWIWPLPCSVGCGQCSGVSGVGDGWWPFSQKSTIMSISLLSSLPACIVDREYSVCGTKRISNVKIQWKLKWLDSFI